MALDDYMDRSSFIQLQTGPDYVLRLHALLIGIVSVSVGMFSLGFFSMWQMDSLHSVEDSRAPAAGVPKITSIHTYFRHRYHT